MPLQTTNHGMGSETPTNMATSGHHRKKSPPPSPPPEFSHHRRPHSDRFKSRIRTPEAVIIFAMVAITCLLLYHSVPYDSFAATKQLPNSVSILHVTTKYGVIIRKAKGYSFYKCNAKL
ncbi:putative nucleotide-diphospho-sugar transferase [Helianthus annuus]|nr:putative nucleotide-diphospho-sugar transferase [Helianthus annuus]KAJ0573072.1 putative nucleotide-diphospho-sugar transferase [Helianthus annuus]KAJ0737503.1 putative nucleotide-diphospho-sugar transferase [Helianthus annuus]KAJ0740375.1 putative nucleotide-diphospho-sugar transferase [Helianthus annuus]